MPELTDFPGKVQHLNIATEIGMQYYMVGTGLLNDERGAIVPAIVSEHRGNAEQINMDILSRWMQGKGISDRTWRGLLGVLRVHCPGLAQDIEETLSVETSDTCIGIPGDTHGSIAGPSQQQSALSLFNKKLRDLYAENPLPYYFDPRCYKWMPNVSRAYIHPDIASKEEQQEQPDSHKEAILCGKRWRITEKQSFEIDEDSSGTEEASSDTEDGIGDTVQLEELLKAKSGENYKCVLVEGGPGMGKSTLAWQVCHRWGRRELFDQYSTVLLFPLRNERVQQAKQVKDLIDDEMVAIQEIGNGTDILVILDGLDELPSCLLSKQSIFTDLLSGKVLSDATILVTSRPSATQQLLTCWKQRISKHFVIHGFSEEDIEEYAKTILSGDKQTDFQKHLSIHPHIQSIMYVPLHSAIVMAVYLQHRQLPNTLTQLYMTLVEIILSQYLDDHPEYCGEEKITCTIGLKLPKPIHTRFTELCKIAFDTVCRQKLIFTDKTMPKELHNLGFTDSVPGLYIHTTCSYNFLHLSIQEFLAAYHVSLLSSHEQEQLLFLLRNHRKYHLRNMMKFVAGITKFEGIGKEALKEAVEEYEMVLSLHGYGLELLYECQNVSILDRETYSVNLGWSSPKHHWLALGYVIGNSRCTWSLQLDYVNVEMLVQGLRNGKTQPTYKIKRMEWDMYNDEIDGKLFTCIPTYFNTHIESASMLEYRSLTHFCQWLPICNLKKLSLLELEPNNLEMVSRALTAVPSLKTLDIQYSKFTLQSMQAFASMLHQSKSLTKVDISICSIDSDCACCMAEALHKNMTLTVLNMIRNSVGDRGAVAIADMLKHNTTLTVLDMTRNSVGDRGAVAIAEMLKHNTALKVLSMRENYIGKRGAIAIAENLKHNTTLTVLDMRSNSVGESGAVAMAEMLKHNTTLKLLDMRDNSVGEKGALAMAKMLKYNTTLEELCIFEAGTGEIGVEGAKALIKSLAVNCHLKTLKIPRQYMNEVESLRAYNANKKRVQFVGHFSISVEVKQ